MLVEGFGRFVLGVHDEREYTDMLLNLRHSQEGVGNKGGHHKKTPLGSDR
jgi:hypothetical protein